MKLISRRLCFSNALIFGVVFIAMTGNTSACSGNVEDEIVRINERLATLNSYGAEPVGKGKKGTGPTGIAKIYSKNKSKFEKANFERESHSDIAMDELLKMTPVAADAVRLIDSMQSSDDCDAVLAKLNALRKQSPANSEHLWGVLIARFNVREAALKKGINHQPSSSNSSEAGTCVAAASEVV